MIRRAFAYLLLSAWPLLANSADLVAEWKLDGEAKDSGASGLHGKLLGRASFFESPIGVDLKQKQWGQLLLLNGIDTALQIDETKSLDELADGSISLWILPLELKHAPILAKGDMRLEVAANGSLRLSTIGGNVETPADRISAGQWYHLVISIKNDGAASLAINGEVAANGRAITLDKTPGALTVGAGDGKFFNGLLDDLRIYKGVLSSDEIAKLCDAGLSSLRAREYTKSPFAGHFEFQDGDVAVFLGGENTSSAQEAGYLETLLTLQARDQNKDVHFRSMAWDGDTLFEQWRIVNFGTWKQQLQRSCATVAFVQFGQLEALQQDESTDLAAAAENYEKLLNEIEQVTRRIVLISPNLFEKLPPPAPDLSPKNKMLAQYVALARKLAEKHNAVFVDLSTAPELTSAKEITRDGLHLNASGQWLAAKAIARQLGTQTSEALQLAQGERMQPQNVEDLRQAILAKNRLWTRHWRPTNWAFLNGDRVTQPSSHDHTDARIRWFPAEIQQYPALIQRAETRIDDLARIAK